MGIVESQLARAFIQGQQVARAVRRGLAPDEFGLERAVAQGEKRNPPSVLHQEQGVAFRESGVKTRGTVSHLDKHTAKRFAGAGVKDLEKSVVFVQWGLFQDLLGGGEMTGGLAGFVTLGPPAQHETRALRVRE